MSVDGLDPSLLKELWPLFVDEGRERLAHIADRVEQLQRGPAADEDLEDLKRCAHNFKGAAGTMGAVHLERVAHAIESAVAPLRSGDTLAAACASAILEAVAAMEAAIAAGEMGGSTDIPGFEQLLERVAPSSEDLRAPPAPPSSPLAKEMFELFDHVRETPPGSRSAPCREAERAALRAAEGLDGPARDVLTRVAEDFARLGDSGQGAAGVLAHLAGELVELEALPVGAPVEVGATGARAPTGAPSNGSGDRSIRVMSSALEGLARRIDTLVFRQGRHQRRARDLHELSDRLLDLVGSFERDAGRDGAGRAADLATGTALRALATDAARLGVDAKREAEQARGEAVSIRGDLRSLRTVTAWIVLEPLRRAVRDVAARLGKEVTVEIEGGDVRVDRLVLDALREPLLHLVRNAVDHGIESPEVRLQAGKARTGTIAVTVRLRGTRVLLTVQDDGGGLRIPRIRAKAIERGVVAADVAAAMSDADVAQFIFRAGLSTAAAVSEVSGRGVGLDIVHDAATRLGGTVTVEPGPTGGTSFSVDVPASIANATGAVVRVGRDVVALQSEAIHCLLPLSPAEVRSRAGRPTVDVDGAALPVAYLGSLIAAENRNAAVASASLAVVVRAGSERAVLVVDEVFGHQELLVAPFRSRLAKCPHVAGTALLEDGRLVAVLEPRELLRRIEPLPLRASQGPATRRTIVVADDSLTTRAAMKGMLELAGYTVRAAADGEEAFELLQRGADLVVSDVQMPRLDGLGLVRRIRADGALARTPVILVTSLGTEEDRLAGLRVGASGYLVKREVERGKMIELVRQLMPAESA